LWGLGVGAFVLTLAFSSRHELWRPEAAPTARATALPEAAVPPHEAMATPTAEAAPVVDVPMNPAPAIAPSEPVQSETYSMENGRMRDPRDPAAEHGSRSR
jgi:hypothetical protein